MVNGSPDIIEHLKMSAQHQLCLYRFYHLPMPDPSPSNAADSLKLNFLQLGRRSGGRPSGQFTAGGYLSTL